MSKPKLELEGLSMATLSKEELALRSSSSKEVWEAGKGSKVLEKTFLRNLRNSLLEVVNNRNEVLQGLSLRAAISCSRWRSTSWTLSMV